MSTDKIGQVVGWVVGFLVVAFLLGRFDGNGGTGGQIGPSDVEEYGVPSPQAGVIARSVKHFQDSARDLPGFQNLVDEAESGDDAFTASVAMSFEGVAYLPPETIDSLAQLRLSLLDVMSTSECAQVADGDIDMEKTLQIFGRLDTVALKHLIELGSRASLARLSEGPHPRASQSEIDQSWTGFLQTLSEDEAEQFLEFVETPSPTDEQLCRAEKLFWSNIPRMRSDDKVLLVQSVAQQIGTQ